MSQLFDSLRRGGRRRAGAPVEGARVARADAVLETLGYTTSRPPRFGRAARIVCLLGVAAIVVWFWWVGSGDNERPGPPPRTASRERAAPAPPSANKPNSTANATPAVASEPNRAGGTTSPAEAPPALPSAKVDSAPRASAVPPRRPTSPGGGDARTGPGRSGNRGDVSARTAPRTTATDSASAAALASPAEVFRLAVYYQKAGDLERAQSHYQQLLQRNQLDPRVHNNLGLLYRDRGMLDFAAREFQRALIINPGYLTARNNLGVVLLAQSRLDEASAEFRRVLVQDPRNVDAAVNLALVEKAAGRPESAKESLLRVLMVDSTHAPAHFNLAAVYEQTGEVGRALEHYRAFLDHAGPEHAARTADARARIDALSQR